jgi:hypothetical protein
VGVGFGVGAGLSVGVGVGVGIAVSMAVGDGLGEVLEPVDPGLGKPAGVGIPVPRLRVVATAARITVPRPPPVAGAATGSRGADGLGLICEAGVSFATTGEGRVAEWRALKYTIVNKATSTMRARLAAMSVGANIDLTESHRPFLRMASLPPCEPSPVGHFTQMAH